MNWVSICAGVAFDRPDRCPTRSAGHCGWRGLDSPGWRADFLISATLPRQPVCSACRFELHHSPPVTVRSFAASHWRYGSDAGAAARASTIMTYNLFYYRNIFSPSICYFSQAMAFIAALPAATRPAAQPDDHGCPAKATTTATVRTATAR